MTETTNNILGQRDDWLRMNMAWRARYQQARVLLEQVMPSLSSTSLLNPLLFDTNTEEGAKRWSEVLRLLDEGKVDVLKQLAKVYKESAMNALRHKAAQAKAAKEPHAL